MRLSNGFTVIELMVVVAIMGLMAAMAVPSVSQTRNQMQVAQAVRSFAQTLGEIRAEAIRTKGQVKVNFTPMGITWDLFNDGSLDGTYKLPKGVVWNGTMPTNLIFDGLGLARNMGTLRALPMKQGNFSDTVYVNKNGYIWL